MTIGFRIRKQFDRVSPDVVKAFRELPVANVSDCMSRMTAGGTNIRPMHQSGPLAGPALTVKCRPGDNLMLHKAIDIAQPGDVIVVDAGGDQTNSLMGELMLRHAKRRGVAGFVLNGAIRDAQAIFELNMPLFASGITHRGPYKDGPGEIGFDISIGGMVIQPGDLMLGDWDGILCVPTAHVDTILTLTQKKFAQEQLQMERIDAGTVDRSWVDKALENLGVEYV